MCRGWIVGEGFAYRDGDDGLPGAGTASARKSCCDALCFCDTLLCVATLGTPTNDVREKEIAMAAAKSSVEKLLELAGQFITKQQGIWEHEDWEALLTKAGALGMPMDDECKRNLGNILEAGKYFFGSMPQAPAKKKAAAAKKAPKK